MRVKIYKMAKSATQSGRGRVDSVILERDDLGPRTADPLMGWVSSSDTRNQIRLRFTSIDDAVRYATENNYDYTVDPVHARQIKPRNYTDKFKYIPPQSSETMTK